MPRLAPALLAATLLTAGRATAQEPAGNGGTTGTAATTQATGTGTTDTTAPAHTEPHVSPYRAAPPNEVREDDFTHKQQFSLRLGFGGNPYFALRRHDSPHCNEDPTQETFCRGAGDAIMDAEMAFAPTDGLEITSLLQVGLANDPFAKTLPIVVALGIRLYPSPHDRVKPFFGFRAALKYLDMRVGILGDRISPWDGGVRAEAGLQVEITRAVGVYAQVAISLYFVNSFTMPFDFTGGGQVRFP